MKICWDNLEGIRMTSNCVFIKNRSASLMYKESCTVCGDPYLTCKTKQSDFCGRSCALSGSGHPFYGKQLTKEHKEKLSKAFSGKKNHFFGKKHTKKVREIISKKATGRKMSPDAIRRSAEAKRGRHYHSEEWKQHLSLRFSGANNPQWRGGISAEPYCPIWMNEEFKSYIKERDGNKCVNPYCTGRGTKIVIHHIDYNKKNCSRENLVTVCNSCNSYANKDRKWHKAWYRAILRRRYGYNYE